MVLEEEERKDVNVEMEMEEETEGRAVVKERIEEKKIRGGNGSEWRGDAEVEEVVERVEREERET